MSNSSTSSHIITCRAAVCWEAGKEPKVEEIQVDTPKMGEVRLKMLFASLCHTDVLCCQGFPTPLFPRVLGHEGVGIVESVGEGVTELKEGDVVIPTYLGECRECENCNSGKTNLCQVYPLQAFTGLFFDGTSRMSIKLGEGEQRRQFLYHFLSCSTWSEYTVVDSNYVVKIDPAIPLRHASFLSCGFSTGFGATWKEAMVAKGSSVAILGLGAVGLGVVEGARVHGAAKIIGIDLNDSKREKELVMELTGGRGVDYSFECTGVPALVNQALESTKVGIGKMIMLGAGTQKSVDIDFFPLLGGRTFKYSVFGGIKIQSDLPLVIKKCVNKEIRNLDELLTYEVQLKDVNKAFGLLKEPDCIKVLINF